MYQCSKAFSQSASLFIDMNLHTGENPYICSYCGKAFTQKGNLELHIRMHTGEKYRCSHCDSVFFFRVEIEDY